MMRTITALATGSLALALVVTVAAPAQADVTETLPAGEQLFAVECENETAGFGTIDPATAFVTLIGTGSVDPNVTCAGMAAYNFVNGLGYWSSWDEPGDLFSVDLVTGVHTFIGHIAIDGGDPFWLEHLAIGSNGVGYGIANFDDGTPYLVSVDLATAEATLIGELGTGMTSFQWWSFAFNPADGRFYATDDEALRLYRVNVATGALTDLGVHGDNWIWYGISFDSEGRIWSACVDDGDSCDVGTTTIADWTTPGGSEIGTFTTESGTDWFTEATFINFATAEEVDNNVEEAPEPELADTGAAETMGLTALAALLMIAGALFVVARRRA